MVKIIVIELIVIALITATFLQKASAIEINWDPCPIVDRTHQPTGYPPPNFNVKNWGSAYENALGDANPVVRKFTTEQEMLNALTEGESYYWTLMTSPYIVDGPERKTRFAYHAEPGTTIIVTWRAYDYEKNWMSTNQDITNMYWQSEQADPQARVCAPGAATLDDVDTDGDGIKDKNDPCVNGTVDLYRPMQWQSPTGSLTDATYILYEVQCSDGTHPYYSLGTRDDSEVVWQDIPAGPWIAGNDWNEKFPYGVEEGQIKGTASGQSATKAETPADLPEKKSGTGDASGSETDNEALKDIKTNTSRIADNQERTTKAVQDVANKVQASNDKLGQIQSDTSRIASNTATYKGPSASEIGAAVESNSTYKGPSASDIGTAVGQHVTGASAQDIGQAVDDALSDTGGHSASETNMDSQTDAAYQSAVDAFNTQNDLQVDAPAEYRQRKDLQTEIDTVLQNQQLQDAKGVITSSGVECVGDCSFSWNYKGNPIQFSICNYASALSAWGIIIQAMAGLTGLLIIFRRN